MRYLFTCLLACGLLTTGAAQFGAGVYYNVNRASTDFGDFEGAPALEEYLDNGTEVALHYWFRLPRKRIEFLPTVFYNRANFFSEMNVLRQFGFELKTNVYPFDFGTDCNCPTFGKQGPALQKGLFVQLAPGYSIYRLDAEFSDVAVKNDFTLAAALGLDFGITDFLTLTPTAGVRLHRNGPPEIIFTDPNGMELGTSRLVTYQFGLQATLRLDERNY